MPHAPSFHCALLTPLPPANTPPTRQKRPYDGDGGGGGDRAVRPRNDAWQPAIVSNGLFEEYYQGQDVCPPEVRTVPVLINERRRGRECKWGEGADVLGECAAEPMHTR